MYPGLVVLAGGRSPRRVLLNRRCCSCATCNRRCLVCVRLCVVTCEPPPLAVRCVLFSVDIGGWWGVLVPVIESPFFCGASPASPQASPPASPLASPPASHDSTRNQRAVPVVVHFGHIRQPRYIAVVYSAKRRCAVFWSTSCFLLHLLRPVQLKTKFPYFSGRIATDPNTRFLGPVVADHVEYRQKRALRIPLRPNANRNKRFLSVGVPYLKLYWVRLPLVAPLGGGSARNDLCLWPAIAQLRAKSHEQNDWPVILAPPPR